MLAGAVRSASHARDAPKVPKIHGDPGSLPMVSIVVPARNEERGIEAAVRSLAAQTVREFEIVVVDDRSTDRTREMLRRLETELPRLRVVDGAEVPEGWMGKPWALEEGVRASRGEWLLFTDADVKHAPEALASALRFALERRLDALSLLWEIEIGSFAEAAILPHILAVILLATGPVSAINDPARTDRAAATGAFILMRRAALAALGGHTELRGEVVEDIEIARLIKRDGRFRFCLAEGRDLISLRMYHSFAEIWNGFTKNVFMALHEDVPTAVASFILLSAVSWVPPALAMRALLRRRPLDFVESLASSVLLIATSAWGIRARGLDARLGFGAPLGLATLAAITANSALRSMLGRGVVWRGRTYR